MKRSSSKLLSKAGSMRNINKQGFKFSVQLEVESVDKLISNNDICVTWERGGKVWATPTVAVNRQTRLADFNNHAMSQEITLFKRKRDDNAFADKVFRLSARNNSQTGKIIGKIDINISEHCAMQPSNKRVGAQLSNGSRIIMRVITSFLREAKVRRGGSKGSAGSSTVDGMSTTSADDTADLADLDDLNIGDDDLSFEATSVQPSQNPSMSNGGAVPSSTTSATSTSSRRPPQRSYGANGMDESESPLPVAKLPSSNATALTSSVVAPSQVGALSGGGAGPRAGRRPSAGAQSQGGTPGKGDGYAARKLTSRDESQDIGGGGGGSLGPELAAMGSGVRSGLGAGRGRGRGRAFGLGAARRKSGEGSGNDDANGSVAGGNGVDGISRAEFEKMRKENRGLRRRNEDLQTRVASLENQIDELQDLENKTDDSRVDLVNENKNLRIVVDDLKLKLKREPQYDDLVYELRETKMALAITTLEKDELMQEVRSLRRG